MQTIKQLPPHEAQKIAAGEVVERPANVVKELIENAIDAGATKISVHCEDAGKQLIRVVDNGCGMSREDARMCFTLHATSKVKTINDLNTLNTFGFRGEALASIASVSKTTMLTKHADDEHGTKVIIDGGIIISTEDTACATGTDLSIRDLFFNVPARQKFLKKRETEWRHIVQLFHAFCLDYQHIHFQLFADGKQMHNCPATDKIKQRLAQLWDHTFTSNIIELEPLEGRKNIVVSGAISNHHYARYDRNNIYFFVNKRWVKNFSLARALLKGYMNVLPAGKYPAACIFIELDSALVDINIHPRKEEVLFLHPRTVENTITMAVKTALEKHLADRVAPAVSPRNFKPFHNMDSTPFHSSHHERRLSTTIEQTSTNNFVNPSPFAVQDSTQPSSNKPSTPLAISPKKSQFLSSAHGERNEAKRSEVESTTETQHSFAPQQAAELNNVIGIYNKTYILLEKEEGLFLLDQHAAHERVLYELFSKRFHDVATIQLLFPHIITLPHNDLQLLEPHLEIFTRNGIETEIFGDNQVKIQSTPVHLKNVSLNELVHDVVSWIKETDTVDKKQFFKSINEKLHAQMACKAAVKAGDTLTHEQVQQLLKDLSNVENRFTCPHGRPTGWLLSDHEIEKKFKRKV